MKDFDDMASTVKVALAQEGADVIVGLAVIFGSPKGAGSLVIAQTPEAQQMLTKMLSGCFEGEQLGGYDTPVSRRQH